VRLAWNSRPGGLPDDFFTAAGSERGVNASEEPAALPLGPTRAMTARAAFGPRATMSRGTGATCRSRGTGGLTSSDRAAAAGLAAPRASPLLSARPAIPAALPPSSAEVALDGVSTGSAPHFVARTFGGRRIHSPIHSPREASGLGYTGFPPKQPPLSIAGSLTGSVAGSIAGAPPSASGFSSPRLGTPRGVGTRQRTGRMANPEPPEPLLSKIEPLPPVN